MNDATLLARLRELPTPSSEQARKISGDPATFHSIGISLARALEKFAGLKENSRVLEIGCGYGRVALPLTQVINSEGSYTGVEIMPEAVAWCTQNIPALHPGFKFHHLDVYNEFYNPNGAQSVSDIALPFEDASLDLVFLTSVFTHLVAEDVDAYMREIARVLTPSGVLAGTWFMVDHGVGAKILDGRAQIPIAWADGAGAYFKSAERGTVAVAYDEAVVDAFHERTGFAIENKRRGHWFSRADAGPPYQDWIIARRR